MLKNHIRDVVIVGGGTAGWMTAAALSKVLNGPWSITLVESEEIGTVGVGEATIPLLKIYNDALEIDENEFMKMTSATFKLGIEFVNWGKLGDSYIHGFGGLGPDTGVAKFHQYWLRARQEGHAAGIEEYAINTLAARAGKFMRAQPDMGNSPLAGISHAFHLDASRFAAYLRKYSEKRGVKRVEGKVGRVTTREADGFIDEVVLESGQRIRGDLFIDCSGFSGLLIEQTLKTGYEDWSRWLPCDRALAVPCESAGKLLPYTRATAHTAGWQWRIPLQHRIGNGHVYCSQFISDQDAADTLMGRLDGKALADPRPLRFLTGKRKKSWNKNCVAVGLSSGFMEPLESTSIHLIQATIARLTTFFPDQGFNQADIDEFNRQTDFDFEKIRDFLILHYKATERNDSEFWNYCRTMDVPDSLRAKIELFQGSGRIFRESTEMFSEISWLEVMLGQGIVPRSYHPLVDNLSKEKVENFLENVRSTTRSCVDAMPTHEDYLAAHCRANPEKIPHQVSKSEGLQNKQQAIASVADQSPNKRPVLLPQASGIQNPLIKTVVIVGGGTSGWMTAAALSTVLRGRYQIRLVESDEIGIVGVGEATIPMIQRFNKLVGIDENEFLKATQGTFKLGIEFVNWGKLGDRYMHGFGRVGQDIWPVSFEQYWQKLSRIGKARDLGEYSITRMAAMAGKFMPASQEVGNSPLADINHAYHFDATLYAGFLSKLSQQRGVQRIEGKIVEVAQRNDGGARDGDVAAVVLASGERIEGDLFIDCSGFRGLLIEQTLKTGFEDWSEWLLCDTALAVPCESVAPLTPYTRSTAHSAGWQWRIPLQHRIGNGHVFASKFVSEDQAAATLLAHLDGKALADPRKIQFVPGMRSRCWNRNVVAIGLASGFIEPLESTAIHLVQSAISRLINFFPDQGFNPVDVDEYNRQSRFEYERIRDFIILHYKLTQRDDSAFWRHCAQMSIPDTLSHKIELYRAHGRLLRVDQELFAEAGWLQVMEGQNLQPESYHPLADLQSEADSAEYLESVREVIVKCVEVMPDHAAYIAQHCAAAKPMMG